MTVHDQMAELAELRRENEELSEQVKELVKAEGKLYRYQEQLDAQLREHQELYRFNRKLNASQELTDIFTHAGGFIVNNLGYERVLFFSHDPEADLYRVCAREGYYRPGENAGVGSLTIPGDAPLLAPLFAGEPCLVRLPKGPQEPDPLAAEMMMDEYLLYPLGSHDRPVALLAVGNSSEQAPFCRRVSDSEMALLGIGNLAGLLSSSVENHVLFAGAKKALEQERLAEAKYRGIFENAMEGICQTTPQGRFLNCNPATAEILGYGSPRELIDSISDITAHYVIPAQRQAMLKELRKGIPLKGVETEFFRKDGSRCWVRMSIRPNLSAAGELLHLDVIMEDINDRKKVEKAIRQLNEELEQRVIERTSELEDVNSELMQLSEELESAYTDLKQTHTCMLQQEKMASIGQLAAGVAHEINNPMGFIISNLNTLGKYAEKLTCFIGLQGEAIEKLAAKSGDIEAVQEIEERKRAMKIAYVTADLGYLVAESLEGAERVKKIVQELKSFSRLDECELKAADLNEGIESTINIVHNELKFKAELKKEYGSIPATMCNPGQLNQVFMNLLLNAAQAIDGFGVITVRTTSSGGVISVSISDNGCGIPNENVERIFEPFYTTKEVGKGTGLGLSIVYDIVKKHNGDILVQSEPGQGTTFTVKLPVVAP